MIPYLLIADLQNTALSAILAFSDRVLYRCYSAMPRLFGFSPLEDQVAAGATMWVGGSLAFVVPAIIIAMQCLSRSSSQRSLSRYRTPDGPDSILATSERLRWRPAQTTLKACEAIAFVVLYGMAGYFWPWLATAS